MGVCVYIYEPMKHTNMSSHTVCILCYIKVYCMQILITLDYTVLLRLYCIAYSCFGLGFPSRVIMRASGVGVTIRVWGLELLYGLRV